MRRRVVLATSIVPLILFACNPETRDQAREAGRAVVEEAKEIADRAPARELGKKLEKAGKSAAKVIEREAKVMGESVTIDGKTLGEELKQVGVDLGGKRARETKD